MLITKRKLFLIFLFCSLSACSAMRSASNETAAENTKKIATAKINTQLGIAYLEQHHIQRAKRKLLTALDEAPTIPDTWYSMGYFLEVTGDKEEARKYYEKALSLAPKRGDVQNNFGTYLCRAGQYQTAIQHFELAVKDINYVDTAAAYENAGLCALKIPDKQLALHYFNRAIGQDPERSTVYLELAELNYQLADYKASKINLDQFLRISPPTRESFNLTDRLEKQLGAGSLLDEL
jgi:type IV pilus assembly protein PilF